MRINKKIYFILLSALVVLFVVRYLYSRGNIEVIDSGAGLVKAEGWDSIISASVSGGNILLSVDGNNLSIDENDIYMSSTRDIMINTEKIVSAFSCACNIYEDSRIVLEKGSNSVELFVNSQTVIYNGDEQKISCAPTAVNNSLYVPLAVFDNYFDYDYEWNYANNTAILTNTKPDEKIYPYTYDCRDRGRINGVKNQYDLGTCWAFASLTALESSVLPEKNYIFSEDHMSYHNGYNLTQYQGGEYNMAMAYLASWNGPVLEEDDPYGDGTSPDDLEAVVHVQEMQIIESKNLDGIKKAVFLYSGVQSSLYISVADINGEDSTTYNAANYSYCHIGTEKSNHDVVIIGWDDSYPASNFATPPEGDGAFICINSWGEDFGDNGIFYVSYYDSNIGVHNLAYTDTESVDNYDNIYQSDLCGWIGQLGYNREDAYFANVYTAKNNESLSAVGFYSTGNNSTYKVYFVGNFENPESLADGIQVAEGTLGNAGYYTVKTGHACEIDAGEKYAVIVYISTPNSVHPIAIEYAADEATSTVDITDGEGYISLHGTNWENVESTQKCNICLKAYTNNDERTTE